jgi:hypothetical protein
MAPGAPGHLPRAYHRRVPRPPQPAWWPVRQPKRIAVTTVLTLFVAGLFAIVLSGASIAYVGTLLVGCTTVGVVLATTLDRRRPSR